MLAPQTSVASSGHSARPPTPLLTCDVRPARDAAVVAAFGEIDLTTAGDVEAHLAELAAAGFDHLILDLGGVEFMDSTGVALLVRWTTAEHPRFSVALGSDVVEHLLELVGLMPLVDVVPRKALPR